MEGSDMTDLSSLDLSKANLPELLALLGQVEDALKKKREEEKPRVLERIQKMAAETGLSVDEVARHLNPRARRKTVGKVAPKYRDPKNPSNTWTGRGKKPKWLTAHIAQGGTVEECKIR